MNFREGENLSCNALPGCIERKVDLQLCDNKEQVRKLNWCVCYDDRKIYGGTMSCAGNIGINV